MRLFLALVLIVGVLSSALAQTPPSPVDGENKGLSITPPKSEQGEKFKASADRRWQRTKGEYLSKNADPEKKVDDADTSSTNPLRDLDVNTARWIAFIVLGCLIAGILLSWWFNRTGGGLFRQEAKEDRFADSVLREAVGADTQVDVSLDDLSFEKLRAIGDPKQGLRLLLLHGLKRASGENNIPLRRSFTTRDIFHRVPENWKNRKELSNIVAHAEPVLFGGRDLDQQNYLSLLEASKPLFAKTGFGRTA